MQVVLIQQRCIEVLKGDALMPETLTQAEKTRMVDKAKSVIILCLRDKLLREVARRITQ